MSNLSKLAACVILMCSIVSTSVTGVTAAESNPTSVSSKVSTRFNRKPRIALALGGGGIRGAAHIGVLKEFEKEGIPVDYVVGNSMGALVGGLYCAGVSLDKIQEVLSDGSMQKAYLPRFLWLRIMMKPLLSLFGAKQYAGIVSGKGFEHMLSSLIPKHVNTTADLKIPFSCIAFNLIDGKTHLLSSGPINGLIRASASIPLLLQPVELNGKLYLDGGIRNNLPTEEARLSGAPIVVSVEIDSDFSPVPPRRFRSYNNVLDRVVNATLDEIDRSKVHAADVVIRPKLINVPLLSKDKTYVREAVEQGEIAARKAIPEIKRLLRERIGESALNSDKQARDGERESLQQ